MRNSCHLGPGRSRLGGRRRGAEGQHCKASVWARGSWSCTVRPCPGESKKQERNKSHPKNLNGKAPLYKPVVPGAVVVTVSGERAFCAGTGDTGVVSWLAGTHAATYLGMAWGKMWLNPLSFQLSHGGVCLSTAWAAPYSSSHRSSCWGAPWRYSVTGAHAGSPGMLKHPAFLSVCVCVCGAEN